MSPGKEMTKSIKQIIGDLDATSLRNAKAFHSEITNELEDIAKIFEKIKVANVADAL